MNWIPDALEAKCLPCHSGVRFDRPPFVALIPGRENRPSRSWPRSSFCDGERKGEGKVV